MMLAKLRARRERRERMERAAASVRALQGELNDAYGRFNRTADPALLEAAILEIGALRSRYSAELRACKTLYADTKGGLSDADCGHGHSVHRRLPHRAAAAAAEKADQMGV